MRLLLCPLSDVIVVRSVPGLLRFADPAYAQDACSLAVHTGFQVMGKAKVLVKVHPEGKYVVDLDKDIDIAQVSSPSPSGLDAQGFLGVLTCGTQPP